MTNCLKSQQENFTSLRKKKDESKGVAARDDEASLTFMDLNVEEHSSLLHPMDCKFIKSGNENILQNDEVSFAGYDNELFDIKKVFLASGKKKWLSMNKIDVVKDSDDVIWLVDSYSSLLVRNWRFSDKNYN